MRVNDGLKRLSLILLLSAALWAAWPAASYYPGLQLNHPVAVPAEAQAAAAPERSLMHTVFDAGSNSPELTSPVSRQELLKRQTVLATVPIYQSAGLNAPESLPIVESLRPILLKDSRYLHHLAGRAPPLLS